MRNLVAGITLAIQFFVPAFAVAANDPATKIPVYPGATKLKYQTSRPLVNICGHQVVTTVYSVADTRLATVVAWYRRKLPGSKPVSDAILDSADHILSESSTFLMPGGANAVSLIQTTYGGPVARLMSAKSRAVTLGFGRYSPPVTRDMLNGKGCAR